MTKISAEDGEVTAKIKKVVSMDGDVDVSQRKGKVITIYDVKLVLEYSGSSSPIDIYAVVQYKIVEPSNLHQVLHPEKRMSRAQLPYPKLLMIPRKMNLSYVSIAVVQYLAIPSTNHIEV